MSDFTPGPWAVFRATGGTDILGVGDAAGGSIAHLWRDGDEREANARLIATAPEMLEALEAAKNEIVATMRCVTSADTLADMQTVLDKIDTSIAKATGK